MYHVTLAAACSNCNKHSCSNCTAAIFETSSWYIHGECEFLSVQIVAVTVCFSLRFVLGGHSGYTVWVMRVDMSFLLNPIFSSQG